MGAQDEEQGYDERTGELLAHRFRAHRSRAGGEPDDLERVALWVDGELSEDEARTVASRVAGDPELRAVVDELRRHEADRMGPAAGAEVISLAAHRERLKTADVVKAPTLGAQSNASRGPGFQRILLSIGGLVAIAAIAFIVTRPSTGGPISGTAGAGLGGAADMTLNAGFVDRGACAVEGVLGAGGERRVWLVGPSGALDLGVVAAGGFALRAQACAKQRCEYLVATPIADKAPAVDAACALVDLPSSAVSVRLAD